jgi:hypothetical protein
MRHIKLYEEFANEAMDTKYWEDYNTDTSGRGKKEHEEKSKDFEDTFEDAVDYWNEEADDEENRIEDAQIQAIKKLAQEFFKKTGWISINVVQAMIAQESMNEAEGRDTLVELNDMALGQLERIADYANMIKERMQNGEQLESWMYSQLTVSLENLNSVHDAMDGNDGKVE